MNGNLPTPYYIVYEEKLRRNLERISRVQRESGAKIIMAFKANALWKTFPIIREYISASTASSLNEMQLSLDYLGNDVHAYCPVYTEESFPRFLAGCSHITFNSLAQFHRFKDKGQETGDKKVSFGLRVNPHFSLVETDIYNPSLPGSRFGVSARALEEAGGLPEGVEGLHVHALCEGSSYDLEALLGAIETQFGKYLPHIKWLNLGGGHLMTRADYDVEHLISLIKGLRERYPNLEVILEPGSAFTWQTGDLVTEVLDVVEDAGIKTAIIDASFACHMPDCLEMPYQPAIAEAVGAVESPEGERTESAGSFTYRLGGNSCLSGDYVGDWEFGHALKPGDRLTLLDMNHYTTVKTTMFNGIQHPAIYLRKADGETELLREYTYEDYRDRMS